jgi:hypothetical protein
MLTSHDFIKAALLTPKEEAEVELCKQMEKMTGQPIIGLRDILHMLTHPDMIPFTEKWLFEWYKENHLTTSREKHLL